MCDVMGYPSLIKARTSQPARELAKSTLKIVLVLEWNGYGFGIEAGRQAAGRQTGRHIREGQGSNRQGPWGFVHRFDIQLKL